MRRTDGGPPTTGMPVAPNRAMADIRFDSIEDGELADLWYALGGSAVRHPAHFQRLFDAVATELLARRGDGLNPWLEQRFHEFRLTDSKEDIVANLTTLRSDVEQLEAASDAATDPSPDRVST